MINVFNKNKIQDNEDKLVLTYIGSAWQRCKKMPSLKEILNKQAPKKVMSGEEMLNQIKRINSQLGGENTNGCSKKFIS